MTFDPGYCDDPWRRLVEAAPTPRAYRPGFRTEWGPVFHRGRLDGSARLLVIGQDPAAHEVLGRRVLLGEAGQRVQAFCHKLGLRRSYAMVNASLYCFLERDAGRHLEKGSIFADRRRWLTAILAVSEIQAVVAFGAHAAALWERFRRVEGSPAHELPYEPLLHPTYPEASTGLKSPEYEATTRRLLEQWNSALERLQPATSADPGVAPGRFRVGRRVKVEKIPAIDLPAGAPAWMRGVEEWAVRGDGQPDATRRWRITLTVPESDRESHDTDGR